MGKLPKSSGPAPEQKKVQEALTQLADQLRTFDFPLFAISEWGHTHRLLTLLRASETTPERKRLILKTLEHLPIPEAVPTLLALIQEGKYTQEAIGALAGVGKEAIPHLTRLFEDQQKNESIRAAAAKGLGQVGRATGDPTAMMPLLDYLSMTLANFRTSADIEFLVLTEVVWGVGQVHNDRTVALIEALQDRIWLIFDTSPEMKTLRETVNVVYKYVDLKARIL